jgi:hypothetical protein
MDRRKFTFGTILGLAGIKVLAQDKTVLQETTSRPINIVEAPTISCMAIDGTEQPCTPKKGEEYCPLGHAQKPEDGPNYKQIGMAGDIPIFANLHICSMCGIVYVPKETK